MEIATIWRDFAGTAGQLAIAALWQGAALALGLAMCLRLAPGISAGDRFRAWVAGFAALAALPFLPEVLSALHSLVAAVAAAPTVPAAQPLPVNPWLDLDPRWSLAIAALWIAASLARVIDLGVHSVRLRRLWKRATPLAPKDGIASEAESQFLSGAESTWLKPCPGEEAARLRILTGRKVEVCSTRDLDRPSVIGFFAPRILIPEWLLERLTAAELEQVMLHEAEHLRRRDDWINLAQKLCLAVFPLNPALAWMEQRLCRDREMACDEGVVRRTRAPRAYAACLANLAERGLQHRAEALSLGAWQHRPELVDRVHRILRRGPGLHPAAARALLGVVGCGLVMGSVELARCPQLVAFAARPASAVAEAITTPEAGPAVADGHSIRRYRAIAAMARVPSRAELAAAERSQRLSATNRVRWSPTLATKKTRDEGARSFLARSGRSTEANPAIVTGPEIAVKAATGVSSSPTAQPQQLIVLTTWEQVASAAPVNGPVTGQALTAGQVVREYSVTRLVIRVSPAAVAEPKTGAAKPASAPNPPSFIPLPAAFPIRDGWLVIQL